MNSCVFFSHFVPNNNTIFIRLNERKDKPNNKTIETTATSSSHSKSDNEIPTCWFFVGNSMRNSISTMCVLYILNVEYSVDIFHSIYHTIKYL